MINSKELLRQMDIELYGFDTSKLSVKEQNFVEQSSRKRWELELVNELRNPQPLTELSKADRLEYRRTELQLAKVMKEFAKLDHKNGIMPQKSKG